jgi:ribosomal protein S16
LYNTLLREKAFYNFLIRKRFYVTRDIISRYLVPLPLVIALFSMIYPAAYLMKLNETFGHRDKSLAEYKKIKRIKIYQYFIETMPSAAKTSNQMMHLNPNDLPKKKRKVIEDEKMLKSIEEKIDYSSLQTIVDFNKRHKQGSRTDPHYKKHVLDPSSQLSDDEIESLGLFLPFFLKQRLFLHHFYLEKLIKRDADVLQDVSLPDQKENIVGYKEEE